jgi:hypothetical protein
MTLPALPVTSPGISYVRARLTTQPVTRMSDR